MAQVASSSILFLAPPQHDQPYRPLAHHADMAGSSGALPAASAQRGPNDGVPGPYSVPGPSAAPAPPHVNTLRPPDEALPTTAASLMREGPRDFTVIKDVGDGSFGTVCLADWKSPLPSGTMLSPMQHPTTRPEYIGKRLVAIKKMKKPFPSWQECMKLKELKSLLTIPPHPNIIPLYDAFLMPTTKELHFVFECMEGNLYQLTKSRKGRPLAAGLVASIYEQIVLGLDHIHEHGYFHRDMKPENLLITTIGLADYPPLQQGAPPEKDVLVIVKLADFGLARETNSKPPYTEYVSTRWYRAPEVLLRSRDYSNPVDMWALGTILAELVNLKPLFPGQSEVDQVLQICEVLGDPSHSYGHDSRQRRNGGGPWDKGIRMARSVGFQFPICKPVKFSRLFSDRIPTSLVDCIQDLLRYDPKMRLTSKDCLQHEYMQIDAPRLRPPQTKPVVSATAPLRPQQNVSRPVPPSHSTPLSAHAKPPFGGADSNLKPLAMLRNPDGSNIVMVNGRPPAHINGSGTASSAAANMHISPTSPMQEDVAEVQWAPPAASMARNASFSAYPPFPDSASVYTQSSAAHNLAPSSNVASSDATVVLGNATTVPSDAQMTETTLTPSDYRHAQALQAHQYEQYQRQSRQDSGQGHHPANNNDEAAAFERERAARSAAFLPYPGAGGVHGSLPGAASSGDLSQKNDSNASNETIGSRDRERRRSKAWGLNISSVFGANGSSGTIAGGSAGSHHFAPGNYAAVRMPSNGMHVGGLLASSPGSHMHRDARIPTEPTPAQRIAAEHSIASGQANEASAKAPLDPKKAKKEAEKAAREAEKARREAQQKAARDRARAVMQKRNQLLASSNSKDPVEWLSGTIQADEPYRSSPSEKARGKQPAVPGSQLSPSLPSFASGEFPRSPLPAPMHGLGPDYSMAVNPAVSGSMAWRGVGAARGSRSNKARRREHDDDHSMSSFEDAVDPRRASMQSYQTGDSDPGPGTGQHLAQAHNIQRASSSSSLASAPSLVDQRRFAPSLESHRSAETRSISSLDHQLITNMEKMTAAEARTRTPGNASPGPAHAIGTRQSVSRQSRANSRASSASAHRQGSASPLHHASGIPRFHPYSHGGPVTPSTGYHPTYQLPPLHQSLHQGVHRGDTGDGNQPALYHAQNPSIQHHINPIFHVPAGTAGHPTTLPPFSSIAATIDVPAMDDKTSQMVYAQTRPSGPLPQN